MIYIFSSVRHFFGASRTGLLNTPGRHDGEVVGQLEVIHAVGHSAAIRTASFDKHINPSALFVSPGFQIESLFEKPSFPSFALASLRNAFWRSVTFILKFGSYFGGDLSKSYGSNERQSKILFGSQW